ncbi:sensor domain-containing diguanylate cyclase [Salinihabitans flavidus]|nr:sensor domain-containing diguanylate cyclase [Salinihabitans flavidus]
MALLRHDALTYSSEASFDQITRLLQLSLDMEMVAISLIGDDKQMLKARQGLDLAQCSRETAFCNIAIRAYEPLVIEDTHRDARVRDNPFVTGSPFLRSYIGAPLTTADGYNLGTICAFDSKPRHFIPRDFDIVRTCAELVMNQLELRSQANLDFLTNVYNRRSFVSGLDRELARLRRSKGTAVLAFLDIDHFKRINDTFGHPVGDRVLRELAEVVTGQCRQTDLVARLGGEEFAVLLMDSDLDTAKLWADRMRKQVAESRFDGSNAIKLTVSLGLAEFGETQTTSDAITHMADSALYEAKRLGRNRVFAS